MAMKWGGQRALPLTRDELNQIHKAMFDVQTSGQWLEKWKDIRDYINPYICFFAEDMPNSGERRDEAMLNTAPLQANNTQAAGMQAGITLPSRPWMRLTVADPDLAEAEEVKYWCDESLRLSLIYLPDQISMIRRLSFIMSWVHPERGIWCRTFTIGEYAIGSDHCNRVNRFARKLELMVAEMVSAFGLDNCPLGVQQLWRSKNLEKYSLVKHLVIPNPNYIEGKLIKWVKKYLSLYWSDDENSGNFLGINGYNDFPFAVSRWSVKGADIYGRGPGWYALGDAKTLQAMEADIFEGIAKQVRPPVSVAADMLSAGGVNTLPNGVTYYNRALGGFGDNADASSFLTFVMPRRKNRQLNRR